MTENDAAISAMTVSDAERFHSKVTSYDQGCWEWTGCRAPRGYGRFRVNGQTVTATRVAYFLATGELPVGLNVCHTCDNPACCRPDHLFVGTQADNMADCSRKGRIGNRLRLDPDSVARACEARRQGATITGLARHYGVSRVAIRSALFVGSSE